MSEERFKEVEYVSDSTGKSYFVEVGDQGTIMHCGKRLNYFRGTKYRATVNIPAGNRQMTVCAARLVAFAWVPNDDPENKKYVFHINGDMFDCRAENLAWYDNKKCLRSEKAITYEKNKGYIKCVSGSGKVKYYRTYAECAKDLGCTPNRVYKVLEYENANGSTCRDCTLEYVDTAEWIADAETEEDLPKV